MTTDSLTEQCEFTQNCSRDAQGFKAVYLRNIAYLFRETSDQNVKNSIFSIIDQSVAAMVSRSCDDNWNCNGDWTGADCAPAAPETNAVTSRNGKRKRNTRMGGQPLREDGTEIGGPRTARTEEAG